MRGLGEACRALQAPIVGGNVSLYNEGATGPIYPTPVIGMVGVLPDARRAGRLGFARAGEEIALVGPFAPSLAASELAKLRGEALPDGLPEFDLEAVRAAQSAVREAVRAGLLSSAHDIAEGGLAVALAECCLAGRLGAEVTLQAAEASAETTLFGEAPGGFIVSGAAAELERLSERVRLRRLGTVGGDSLKLAIAASDGSAEIAVDLAQLDCAHGRLAELFS